VSENTTEYAFAGIKIITVQDSVAGEIHIGVKGLLGALYLKDLAQKTHRGQAGVVRDGRHNGGRSYGYRPVLGRPGVLEIYEAEAAVVRRICRDYLGGRSPRDSRSRSTRSVSQVPAGESGMPPPSQAAGRGETAFCKTSSTAAASSGADSASLRTPRRENELAGRIRRISG
jgi:site-specific DNA recombinase